MLCINVGINYKEWAQISLQHTILSIVWDEIVCTTNHMDTLLHVLDVLVHVTIIFVEIVYTPLGPCIIWTTMMMVTEGSTSLVSLRMRSAGWPFVTLYVAGSKYTSAVVRSRMVTVASDGVPSNTRGRPAGIDNTAVKFSSFSIMLSGSVKTTSVPVWVVTLNTT